MPRNPLFFAVFALSLAIFAAPAAADAARDGDQNNDQDLIVRGCSSIIEGKAAGNKAIAFNSRGLAYHYKGEHGGATADFIRAKELKAK